MSRTQSSNDGVSLNKEPLKALGVVSKIEYQNRRSANSYLAHRGECLVGVSVGNVTTGSAVFYTTKRTRRESAFRSS